MQGSPDPANSLPSARRRFLAGAAGALAVIQLGASSRSAFAAAATGGGKTNVMKQVNTDVLSVSYAELGSSSSPTVILLHGWPYDIHSFDEVGPLLAEAGMRVVTPYLRGYGSTRFLSAATLRNGQPAALALDTVALMDALRMDRALLAGFDWGARTADIVAALWPERVRGLVAVNCRGAEQVQVGGQGKLNTATEDPAGRVLRIGKTAGAVDPDPIDGNTQASAHGSSSASVVVTSNLSSATAPYRR